MTDTTVSNTTRTISWDVGVINLAYCVLEHDNTTKKTKILDWDIINLLEDERSNKICNGTMKSGDKCIKKASYELDLQSENLGHHNYCKTHVKQANTLWSIDTIDSMFQILDKGTDKCCTYVKRDGEKCGKVAKSKKCTKRSKSSSHSPEYFCTAHHKLCYNKQIQLFTPKLIKKINVQKYPISKLQIQLIHSLDKLLEHFSLLKIENVVIENQPSYMAPKMKSISNTLFVYFLMRGHVDKVIPTLKNVNFMSPSNKLKVGDDNKIIKVADKTKKYKLTKELGIKYTRQLLEDDEPILLEYLDLFKKKDDLCDAYLQGLYYLNRSDIDSKKKKKRAPKRKKQSGSKTSNKRIMRI